ncbi:unnamed protein product [Agarophyton chilense]
MRRLDPKDVGSHLNVKKEVPKAQAPPVEKFLITFSSESERKSFRRKLNFNDICTTVTQVVESPNRIGGETGSSKTVSKSKKSVSVFSEDEFARLLLLIRDDDQTKLHVRSLSATLSRAQQMRKCERQTYGN